MRVVLEVDVEHLLDTINIIYESFSNAEIEKIERSDEEYSYRITFSTSLGLKQILEVLDKYELLITLVSLRVI